MVIVGRRALVDPQRKLPIAESGTRAIVLGAAIASVDGSRCEMTSPIHLVLFRRLARRTAIRRAALRSTAVDRVYNWSNASGMAECNLLNS